MPTLNIYLNDKEIEALIEYGKKIGKSMAVAARCLVHVKLREQGYDVDE